MITWYLRGLRYPLHRIQFVPKCFLIPYVSIILVCILSGMTKPRTSYFKFSRGGEKYESKAEILGGVILILIGLRILIF